MVVKTQLEQLTDERDRLVFEMEALRNKIAGLELAIRLVSAEREHGSSVTASGKVRVSDVIVELLRESGESGLKPKVLVELAANRGIRLNRGSVYTILNRMEHMGTVAHENTHYRLQDFADRYTGRDEILPTDKPWDHNKH
jgi:hypothetical protein